MLHHDPSLFEQVILRVSEDTGIEASIIEKDYYVTLFLQRFVAHQPNIIFKDEFLGTAPKVDIY